MRKVSPSIPIFFNIISTLRDFCGGVKVAGNFTAIHPTIGWWRTRAAENRFERSVRYTIIVSIFTPSTDVDIYTPVAVQVGVEVPIEL
jgi:hypothetical protein